MIATILTAAAVYVATGIDYLVILILLFSQVKKGQVKHIWIGQYIGTVIVIGASLLVAQGVVNLIPQQWVIGLLGLLPLYLGVKMWIKGEEDEDESSILSLFSSGKFNQLFLTMTFIVLASSADDFSIYIPYFTTLNMSEIFIDRKSTRLNSSHVAISYAVFCLKKKKKQEKYRMINEKM